MPPRPAFDRAAWERRWADVLGQHAHVAATRPPNPYLVETASRLAPGRAVDAGCGHGAETLWLAARGWQVTAVDFAETALAHVRATATALGDELAARVALIAADLGTWAPPPAAAQLVASLYVHIGDDGDGIAAIRRLAGGVAPGGVLLLAGHQPVDPQSGAPTAAAAQRQVSLADGRAALAPTHWDVEVAEERRRTAGGGVDAVIVARRRA
jgi:SAM-dependent methyltransferase